eukprot:TRINITY_DN25563_c0_g1_i1.p1 TRINITY_DN25563_c0_g1~~TRINITY_DN25563_c0_g1_i1.p1  ORF type:complete len:224 (-),score=58.41 TRINITY_DN25563_c0_g1_i1:77-748(-)
MTAAEGDNVVSDPPKQAQTDGQDVQNVSSVNSLEEIRLRHREAYQKREEEAAQAERAAEEMAKLEQQKRDEEFARTLAEEEEKEQRQRQMEADEEYSRQLSSQLNPGYERQIQAGGQTNIEDVPLDGSDGDLAASYHQMEDGEYRTPMRTGYTDRLIGPPMETVRAFPPLLSFQGGSLEQSDDSARQAELQNAAVVQPSLRAVATRWVLGGVAILVLTAWINS